jgi:hypothetical protein
MSTVAKTNRPSRQGKATRRRFPKLSSAKKKRVADFLKSPLFGLWKDYPGTVEDYMREVRKPRFSSVFGNGPVR